MICFPILLTVGEALSDENSWSTNGPAGGSVYAIEIHPQNPDIIYVGTIQNGIYRTSDGGNHWNHLDSPDQLRCMREIAIHPYAPDTIYATSVDGLFKSADEGLSWAELYPPHGIDNEYSAFLLHCEEPNLLFAGGPLNEWKSTDSGQSWEQLGIPHLAGIEEFAVNPLNPNEIYLATNTTSFGNGVFKSMDRGASWQNIQNNIAGELFCWSIAIDPQDTNLIYIGLHNPYDTDSCLFKSTNSGQSWADISPTGLSQGAISRVRVSPFGNHAIFACTWNDGLFRSTDGGENWISCNEDLKTFNIGTIEFDSLNNIIYLGTLGDGIYKSTDDGMNWQKISQNIGLMPCLGLSISPSNPSLAFVPTAGGLYKTSDAGESWSHIEVGFPEYHKAARVLFDRHIYANIYLSTYHLSPDVQVYETGFYRSTDSGDTWQFLNSGLPGDNSYIDIAVSYLGTDDRRIFLSSYRGIYFSDDMGHTWNLCANGIPPNTFINALAVAQSDESTIAAGTGWVNNRVFLSTDRGQSWEEPINYPDSIGSAVRDIEFDPMDAGHIYVGTDGAGIFESMDGGQSWMSILNDLPAYPDYPTVSGIAINPYNPSNIFVSSSRYGIYQSHNGGQNWEPFNEGLDTTATAGYIEFAPGDTNRLYFASGNRSVWTITRTATGIDEEKIEMPSEISLRAYPNPFNSEIIIEYNAYASENITIEIYDIIGRKVKTLIDQIAVPGSNAFRWDGANDDHKSCPSGIYFARMTSETFSATAKMLLLK
jgi:photosystem II stability/assembly factor-like uncharacterized protein